MTVRDLIVISTGNLRRMKLRTFLTTSGVLIAIAAFVSMLSFGAGNQEYIEGEFNRLGLFSTMQVYPKYNPNRDPGPDTSNAPKLDRSALERIAAIPGVNLVYPFDAFTVTVRLNDSVFSSRAQALPSAAVKTRLFSTLLAGAPFDSNSARDVIISDDVLKRAGIGSPDSALGKALILSARVSTVDSGIAHVIGYRPLLRLARQFHVDSLRNKGYLSRFFRTETSEAFKRFLDGYMNAPMVVSDTLMICGVRESTRRGRLRGEQLIVPTATASRLSMGGPGDNVADIFGAMRSGTFFSSVRQENGKTYPQVTVDFDPKVYYKSISDSVEALGFRTFSFAAEFKEIQKMFLYFDLGLGVIGLIALITASLGIVNTMVMSITERRKEIGILKSLGADERDIRWLFLVESAVIGLVGTAGGIFFGWVITRVISLAARAYMQQQGIPEMDLFALPPWLFLTALGIGVGVAVMAGFYPAARAARVDPVEALRNE
jgi:ABC-type antimicrobial peptide transport system permease subunit